MPFCPTCGKETCENDKFCPNCGKDMSEILSEEKRKEVYDGQIHKCPSCGKPLKAFAVKCEHCNFELRDVKSSKAIQELVVKFEKETSSEKKITLIKNCPIPNSKEDIFEFMLLAASNFDADYYVKHLDEEDISDAWLVKVEQCYQKAKFVFDNDSDFEKIEKMYNEIITKINKKRSKKKDIIFVIVGALLLYIPGINVIGLVLMIIGICKLVKRRKKR